VVEDLLAWRESFEFELELFFDLTVALEILRSVWKTDGMLGIIMCLEDSSRGMSQWGIIIDDIAVLVATLAGQWGKVWEGKTWIAWLPEV